jgi:alkylation response protein AidB-like acyl-CoA dehydrogenase
LNGVATGLLERTVAYVKDRKQFGRPVGSFQAVKHKLASMHQAIETSRPAAWYAAYALAHDAPDAVEAVSVAKAAAGETEDYCNTEALQCHGGIGFTWEDDLHFWLKRGMVLRGTWGTARQHRRHLVDAVMEL